MPDDADHQVAGAEPKGATSTGTFKPPNFLEALKTAVQPKPRPAGRAKAQPARGTDADAKAVQYIDRRERFLAGFLGVFQLVMGVYSYFYLRSVIVKPSTHAPKLSIAQAHAQTLNDHNAALEVLIVNLVLGIAIGIGVLSKRRSLVGFALILSGLALMQSTGLIGIIYLGVGLWLVFRSMRRTPSAKAAAAGAGGRRTAGVDQAALARGAKETEEAVRRAPVASKRYTPPRQRRRSVPKARSKPEPENESRLGSWLRR